MNNDVRNLKLKKKEIINEWLEFINTNREELLWQSKNRVFSSTLYNVLYSIKQQENNECINKQYEMVSTIGKYINAMDKTKVENIVKELKDLDDGKEIKDSFDFNNIDKMISDIDNKLKKIKQEELEEAKTEEEKEKIIKEWDELEKDFNVDRIVNNFTGDINNNQIAEDNDTEIINLLINKISSLDSGTKFTISGLLGDNSQATFKIAINTVKKAKELGINIKPKHYGTKEHPAIIGLPQNIPYIKL